ncbi:hypothetical protein GCM10010201_08320 [Pilimelia columellifera subsp. columellifera]|uniref:Uncharacterized protein n=1 Tax=Pilimelia columellifera subsp. columellifera TaxID=706583 RepID=A0ABN3N4Y8_9ACTN
MAPQPVSQYVPVAAVAAILRRDPFDTEDVLESPAMGRYRFRDLLRVRPPGVRCRQ